MLFCSWTQTSVQLILSALMAQFMLLQEQILVCCIHHTSGFSYVFALFIAASPILLSDEAKVIEASMKTDGNFLQSVWTHVVMARL
jgi:hypothetical protein